MSYRPKWAMLILLVGLLSTAVSAQTTMTIDQIRQAALEYNRTYLTAIEDTKLAEADIVRTRADALPEIRFDGGYTRTFTIPKIFFSTADSLGNTQTMELQTGFKHGFRGTLSARQPIWHGGTVYTAYGIAKLYREYSGAKADQVKAEVLYNADLLFYQISLKQATLDVVNNQYKAASENYDVVAKMREQGVASEYELLQAAVNRDNLKPQIIAAESELALAERNLKSWIGVGLDEDVTFVETPADTSIVKLPGLELLTNTALERRPEMLQSEYLVDISNRAIRVAKGDYFPHLDAVAAYDWSSQSDEFSLDNNISKSWTAGLTISFPLFEGWRTKGNVSERKAQNKQARLNRSQAEDMIRLEVRQAYDQLLQAKKTLDVQGATIAQAEEGLKIANIRYSSGVGTQLEVLSAQAALSQARAASSLAIFQFHQALAGLKKATTVDFERESLS